VDEFVFLSNLMLGIVEQLSFVSWLKGQILQLDIRAFIDSVVRIPLFYVTASQGYVESLRKFLTRMTDFVFCVNSLFKRVTSGRIVSTSFYI
jgi:hypothetical protein